MTNPDNAVGTNAAYGGRTSVNAFNDDLGAYTRGVLSGWACTPDVGLTVTLGGDGNTRDVAIAEDAAGNKTTINNRSNSPISVTIGAAPASNTRIDAIVAYVDASPQGSATITDNYEACGLITVPGSASASPVAPSESAIRSAITADGASGATAYYVVLAYISMASGTTDITANQVTAGEAAKIGANNLDFVPVVGDYSLTEISTNTKWIDGKTIYKKTIDCGALPGENSEKTVNHNISNLDQVIDAFGMSYNSSDRTWQLLPMTTALNTNVSVTIRSDSLYIVSARNTSGYSQTYFTLYYTKTS